MADTADDLLEHIRALPERERLRLVEGLVREVVGQRSSAQIEPACAHPDHAHGHWADVSDQDFEAFMEGIRTSRSAPWRTLE